MADTGIKLLHYCALSAFERIPLGATGYTIGSQDPWGVPLDETFFPELLQARGWVTAVFGKWHMGMFKEEYLPTSRGFNFSTGMLSGASDHYTHVVEGAYDWHAMEQPNFEVAGRYAGNLVRDDALAFIEKVSGGSAAANNEQQPFFLYLPFQECHSPFQVDSNYSDLYPHLPKGPRRTLPGMVTHTDEMIGDVIRSLKAHSRWDDTVVFFSADNGGPGNEGWVSPSRWDPHVIERNWPYKGQKHEVFEGGVHVAGWINGGLLPPSVRGSTHSPLLHVTDWAPTIMKSLAGVDMAALSRPGMALDGVSMWDCLTAHPESVAKQAVCEAAGRRDILYNVNLLCDEPSASPTPGSTDFLSEVPAPKAGTKRNHASDLESSLIFRGLNLKWGRQPQCGYGTGLRVGDMVLLAECYDYKTKALRGRKSLYNITADVSQENDLAATMPATVAELGRRIESYGAQAVEAATTGGRPVQVTMAPWAALWDPAKQAKPDGVTSSYFCADCPAGVAPTFSGGAAWSPWCKTPEGSICPPNSGPPPSHGNCSSSDFCANHPICDCHCFCTVCHGVCGDGCYDECVGGGGCKNACL